MTKIIWGQFMLVNRVYPDELVNNKKLTNQYDN